MMKHKDQWIEEIRLSKTRQHILNLLDTNDKNKSFRDLESAYKHPYHGRLKFQKADYTEDIYIGKYQVDGPFFISSVWSPVGKLFIQGQLKNNFVDKIFIKRHIDNQDGIISKIHDDILSEEANLDLHQDLEHVSICDYYLMEKLFMSSSNRMKDIVATLQKEQDDLIRHDLNTALIIQGVAGSGKTAVALHRIAYLAYNYGNKMNKILVVGPNRIYLNYISLLLPDLGVHGAIQTTYIEFVKNMCNKKAINTNQFASRSDDSLLLDLNDYINELETNYFNKLTEFTFKANEKNVTFSVNPDNLKKHPINRRVLIIEQILKDKLIADLGLVRKVYTISRKKRRFESQEISDMGEYNLVYAPLVKKYIKKTPVFDVSIVLNEFISKYDGISTEDSLAIELILTKLIKGLDNYDHIVIDEAQNLSPLAFASLALLQDDNKRSMTILGDICQRLDNELFSWSIFNRIAGSSTKNYVLRYGYRSTDNIVHLCNEVISYVLSANDFKEYSSLKIGRVYENPELLDKNSFDFVNKISELLKKPGVNLLAVICKKISKCNEVYQTLNALNPMLIEGDVLDYKESGIVIMTVEQSQGLEFDAVVIPDAELYNHNYKDAKTFYLAISRAMHRLLIFYDKRIPFFLDRYSKQTNPLSKDM